MDGTARTISSVYDAGSRRIHVGATTGYAMNFSYDSAGNALSLYDGNNETIVQFGYDSAGRRQTLALGPGGNSPVSYGYDPVGRLASLSDNIAATPGYQALTFAYNPASQIVTRTSSNDAFASNTAYNINRGYSVNGLNQYTAAGGVTFQYDANGNLTSDGSSTYVYDAENRLVSRTGGVSLAYDPNGRLWQLAGPSGATRFEYDGDKLLEEFNTDGNWVRLYAWGPGVDEPLVWYEGTGGPVRRYLHADHQGSVIAVTDDSANPIAINGYDAWGIPNAANGGRFQYTGQAWLGELGLYYYKARIYSPTLGRFLQTDPVGYEDQVNLYAYVGNDPVDGRDPDGEYGRGSGFTDDQWKKFNKMQQRAASDMEKRAAKLDAKATKLDQKGKTGGAGLRQQATALRGGASALRSDGSDGRQANVVDGNTFSNMKFDKDAVAAATVGGTQMYLNADRSEVWAGDAMMARWVVGHESLHTFGLRDQMGFNNQMAYKWGRPEQQKAYEHMSNTPQALINPDHIMDEVY